MFEDARLFCQKLQALSDATTDERIKQGVANAIISVNALVNLVGSRRPSNPAGLPIIRPKPVP